MKVRCIAETIIAVWNKTVVVHQVCSALHCPLKASPVSSGCKSCPYSHSFRTWQIVHGDGIIKYTMSENWRTSHYFYRFKKWTFKWNTLLIRRVILIFFMSKKKYLWKYFSFYTAVLFASSCYKLEPIKLPRLKVQQPCLPCLIVTRMLNVLSDTT